MRRIVAALLATSHWRVSISLATRYSLLLTLASCRAGLHGDWHMVECNPNPQVFCIDDAAFHGDGTYAATTTRGGRTLREIGSYQYNGFRLTLLPQAGGAYRYQAALRLSGLEITDNEKRVLLQKGRNPRRAEAGENGAAPGAAPHE
ncbi:hypothetical protein RAS1_02120 [Phycisphaerae bacterium RAS1]|nr:hypothetical protein RAS1_02120 [Phycisphaerae bacterium RAS1]